MAQSGPGMSGMDIAVTVSFLSDLEGAYVDNLYQPTPERFVVRLNVPKELLADRASLYDHLLDSDTPSTDESDIVLSSKVGRYTKVDLAIHLGRAMTLDRPREAPKSPSSFVMFLRKYLRRARLMSIRQHELDRIIILGFDAPGGTFQVVVELFRDGNVILLQDGIIIHPLFTQHWRSREIKAKEKFEFPPSRSDPRMITLPELLKVLSESKKDLVRCLISEVGLPAPMAELACKRTELPKNANPAEITAETANDLLATTRGLLAEASSTEAGYIYYSGEVDVSDLDGLMEAWDEDKIAVENVTTYKIRDTGHLVVPSFLHAISRIYSHQRKTVDTAPDPIQTELGKLERRLKMQQEAIERGREKARTVKKIGDLIYSSYQKVETIIKTIGAIRDREGWEGVKEQAKRFPGIHDIDPKTSRVTLMLDEQEITLDMKQDVNGNAAIYYDRAKTMVEKSEGALRALEKTEAAIARLKKEGIQLEKKGRFAQTKRYWFENFRWCVSSDGHLILGGKDTISNERLVKKHLKEGDKYAHADYHGAPSVVIKGYIGMDSGNVIPIPEESLREACFFTAINSRAWHAKIGSASAYWVNPSQVSKSPQSGEFVPKGAFIIRGKRNLIDHIPIEAAIGEVLIEGNRKIMEGPVSALTSRSKRYLIIAPGKIAKSKFANRLAKEFQVPQEEILSILPPGDISVLESVGMEWAQDPT